MERNKRGKKGLREDQGVCWEMKGKNGRDVGRKGWKIRRVREMRPSSEDFAATGCKQYFTFLSLLFAGEQIIIKIERK